MQGLLSIVLLGIFWEDVRRRSVHLLWFVALFLTSLFWNTFSTMFWLESLINLCLVGFVGLCLWCYVYARFGKEAKLSEFIGAGDGLFWLLAALFFSPLNFILYWVLSIMGSLMIHLCAQRMTNKMSKIPLAGYQALFFLIVSWSPINLRNDWMWIEWIN